MNGRSVVTSLIPAVLCVSFAHAIADDVWFCTYTLGTKEAEIRIASKFEVHDGALFESNIKPDEFDLHARYWVLQDDPKALIAASANADVDPDPATAAFGSVVIMIEKHSGAFQYTGAVLGRLPMQSAGQCAQGSE
jgi:hypothetical protein